MHSVLWHNETPCLNSFASNRLAPSVANPERADKPSVLPIAGSIVFPNDKIEVNKLPLTCFQILVLDNLISIPYFYFFAFV